MAMLLLLLNAQISLAWLRAPTTLLVFRARRLRLHPALITPRWQRVNHSASSLVASAEACAGLRRRRFFLYLAEFIDAIRPGSFPNMRSRRQHNGRLIKTKMRDRICFPTRLVPGLIFWLSALFIANKAHAALADTVAEYTFPASSLVMSPTRPVSERIPYE